MEYWKYNKTYGSAIFFQLFIGQKSCQLAIALAQSSISNPQSTIFNLQFLAVPISAYFGGW
jgi:hypothetical protein